MRWPITRVVLLSLTLLLSGCRERHAVSYDTPVRMDDLAPGLSAPENSFVLLTDTHTAGRFACRIAVAKFVPAANDAPEKLTFVPLQRHEQAYWTEQMRGVAAVQEFIFFRPRSTKPEGQSLTALCETAERLEAPLLLVYVASGFGPNSARVLGVLYDSATRQPIATLGASSRILDRKGEEVSPNPERGDHRNQDARYLAQRAFEEHALACLRELIHRDSHPTTTQPHKWNQPFIERWWVHQR
jgi:hypothetical protein